MGNGKSIDIEANPPPKIHHLINDIDSYLRPYEKEIKRRYACFLHVLEDINENHGGLELFSSAYDQYGVHVVPETNEIRVLEWLPSAKRVFIRGDFNEWRQFDHEFKRLDYGKWEIEIAPLADGSPAIPENSHYKLLIETLDGKLVDRLCPWSRLVEPPKGSIVYASLMQPRYHYKFVHKRPKWLYDCNRNGSEDLRIYEAHIGISSSEQCVASYDHFRLNVLPPIQLMAIMEHAYYASFGYQVTSFFAPSSRFGSPDDLRRLIDACHEKGIVILLDLIHSHASKNTVDGLNELDGSDTCYFHNSANRGTHALWDSRLFNYSNIETLRFLLSNVRYWLDEFGFDGFRFDGVTSMIYHSHGIDHAFSGNYDEYFGIRTDTESIVYKDQ
ncbi:hypothetical protein ACOME3_010191 [Neoechinorhynchus agilis]